MRTILCALIVAGAAGRAEAGELFYKWEKGKIYRFGAKSDETVKMSGMGINMAQRYFTESTFSLAIDRVKSNGVAEGTLSIESFLVKDENGRVMATIAGLPPSAVKNLIEVDKKGAFVFKEEVYLLVDEQGGNLLVSASITPNSGSATAQHGNQEISVWASFDPKTGQLSGGSSVKEIAAKKKQTKVKVTQDKPRVDLVPRTFMELLRLPDGPVAGGDAKMAMSHPNLSSTTKIAAQILESTKSLVKVRTTFTSANEANVPAGDEDAEDQEDDGAGAAGMPDLTGMPGMEGMNIPGMKPAKGAKKGGAAQMGMNVTGDATIEMNPDKGTLDRLSGTIRTETSAGGMMSIDNETKLELVRKD
jgi:hypothetical protein